MICGLHGLIGAALGKLLGNKQQAFAAGVASHLVADLVPHRDLPVAVEVSLALGVTALMAVVEGTDSPAFWGAVGGMLPDVENAISYIRPETPMLFPTHQGLHGRKVEELLSPLGIALICTAVLLWPEKAKRQLVIED
jgi:hypothetical protein